MSVVKNFTSATKGSKSQAMIHSLNHQDEVIILHERGTNDVVAEYRGVRYTAIFNPFSGFYYVDDVYGELPKQHHCPYCGTFIP